jgi:hypothetical protein
MIVCQSDFDREFGLSTRPADECFENWWEPEYHQDEGLPKKDTNVTKSHLIVERETRRRGLLT